MNTAHLILFLVSLIIIGVGLFGLVTPIIPGVTLIWAGLFLYGGMTRFRVLDLNFFILSSLIVLVTFFLDYLSTKWKARNTGGERWALLGGVVGAFIGIVFSSWTAMIILAGAGALVSQLFFGKMSLYAVELPRITIIGMVSGTLLHIMMGMTLLTLFVWKVMSAASLY